MRKKKWFFIAPLAVAGGLALIAIGSTLVMLLWNWLLPPLFAFHQITFWQAFGILALCRILFGGFGGRGYSRREARHRIADRVAEHWDQMSPEERERIRERMRGRWGFEPPAPEGKTE